LPDGRINCWFLKYRFKYACKKEHSTWNYGNEPALLRNNMFKGWPKTSAVSSSVYIEIKLLEEMRILYELRKEFRGNINYQQ
jgi:hypothetical protein